MKESSFYYGKILHDLAVSQEAIEDTMELFRQNPVLTQVLQNPVVTKLEKHQVIERVFCREIHSFLKVLCDYQVMEMVHDIFTSYKEMVLEDKNIIGATLCYVTRPEEEQIEQIKQLVCSKYNKAGVVLTEKEEPSLLGGFTLVVGNTEYDKSIKGTLSQLKKALVWR